MTHALAQDSKEVALSLHELLRQIDPARWRDHLEAGAREHVADIEAQINALLEHTWSDKRLAHVRDELVTVVSLVEAHGPGDGTDWWADLGPQLQPAYESLAASLRALDIHVPSLRPTNYARNVLHIVMAIFVICLVQYVLVPFDLIHAVAIGGFCWAWSMEISRRFSPTVNRFLMWVFGPFAHPHEAHRVNSATWYTTAILILAYGFDLHLGVAALAVLGLGDPMAALVGRRFGRIRLIHGRSLEGTSAFVVSGTLAAWLTLWLWPIATPQPALVVAIASATALFGAVAELASRRVDDNFAIPLAGAFGGQLVVWFFGSPLLT
jgi:dolichol kinase